MLLGLPPQGVRSKVDFVCLIVDPENAVSIFFKPEVVKTVRTCAQKLKHWSLRKNRPQVDDSSETVFPDDPDEAKCDGLCTMHRNYVGHLIFPDSDNR